MYYCLIASLSDLSLQTDVARTDFSAIRREIGGELSARDRAAVELLYGYYDVENLLAVLRGSDVPHNDLGNLSKEQIAAEIAAQGTDDEPFVSLLAAPLRGALDLYLGRVELDEEQQQIDRDQMALERGLLGQFYRACESSSSGFLSQWATADRTMRNVLAGADFMVGELYEEYKETSWWGGMEEVLGTKDFVEREHKLDAVRWELSDELAAGHYFDLDAVLSYIVKLNILQRWAYLNKTTGRERFGAMVQKFTANTEI